MTNQPNKSVEEIKADARSYATMTNPSHEEWIMWIDKNIDQAVEFGRAEERKKMQVHNKYMPVADRFWARVDKTGKCWDWTGRLTSGYGSLKVNNKETRAHRLSWELNKGKIPKDAFVLHKCDNRKCVNPEHLYLGDYQDNANDTVQRADTRQKGKSFKTHCMKGHEFGENTYWDKKGYRECRLCRTANRAKYSVIKAERERILEALPEEKKIPKDKAWICETCGNYNDPMGLGDDMCPCNGYNQALKEIKNIIKGKEL